MVYSNASLSEYPATDSNVNLKNAYEITFRANSETPYIAESGTQDTFGIVIPSALASVFGVKGGDVIKLQMAAENDFTTRFQVRSTASTVPGMFFTDYQSTLKLYEATLGVQVMISEEVYGKLLD